MLQKVRKYIQSFDMLEQNDRVVVGVSGGADSVALLLVLQAMQSELDLQLYVVHINHGIRAEATEDAEYVRGLCLELGVPFYLFEADIPKLAKEQGLTEEEMGRVYRYQCFEEVLKQVNGNKIAVAHHMDDQAETLLFHLARGSRLAGMEGMRPVTDDRIIRPLLGCRKEELINWLKQKQVSWREDITNEDNIYARNNIRNQVVPVLEQVNAQAVAHMAEFAEEMTAYRACFQKAVDAYVDEHVSLVSQTRCECNREHLLQQQMILVKSVIYEMLVKVCGCKKDIGNIHVSAVYELLQKQSGKQLSLPYGMEAQISYEMLIIRKSLEEAKNVPVEFKNFHSTFSPFGSEGADRFQLDLPDGGVLWIQIFDREKYSQREWDCMVKEATNSKNTYTKYFECDTIKDTLCVRVSRPEDYLVIAESGARKKLSRYFIDEKIPIEQRKRILVLAENEKVLWVLGRRRCEEYKVTTESNIILKATCEGEW